MISSPTPNLITTMDTDKSAVNLANQIRNCISRHMKEFDATQYQEMIASAIIALYLETARIKWLSISTNDVKADDFDKVFMNGVNRHYAEDHDKPDTRSH